MIDVSEKERSLRVAIARAELRVSDEVMTLLSSGRLEKGDALAAARLAGITGAKLTPMLLPLCHPIALQGIDVAIVCDAKAGLVRIETCVRALDRTGVEMEALTAATTAALTIYDMCKRHDRAMEICSVRLVQKSGGRSGDWNRPGETRAGSGGRSIATKATASGAKRAAAKSSKKHRATAPSKGLRTP
jgi:cyclic pyranopterin phosphate synthase